MKTCLNISIAFFVFACLVFGDAAHAQCDAHALACLDVETQELVITVWTGDPHCPASGYISILPDPPDALETGPYDPEFSDVFSAYHSIRVPVHGSPMYPPGTPFLCTIDIVFDDPVYPPIILEEPLVITDPSGFLDQDFSIVPCMDSVPSTLMQGQSECFVVCHRIYRIALGSLAAGQMPVIQVILGCGLPCIDNGCTPGDEYEYRYDVYEEGGQWILEFEYSNMMNQPVCYCVTYSGSQSYTDPNGLIAVDEAWQTVDLTLTNPSGLPLSGIVDLFTYPDGGWIAPYVPDFYSNNGRLLLEVPSGGGMYTPGEEFQIIAYVEHDGGPTDWFPPQWFVEDIIVTPLGGLEVVDEGGECTDTFVPPALGEGEFQCFKVCHDIYHVELVTTVTGTPNITVSPGCGPPSLCPEIPGCNPGGADDYRYDIYRIGGTWMLEFEYSNPNNEPVCYCVGFTGMTPDPTEAYVLAALDEANQTLNVTVWTNERGCENPASGTITVSKGPYDLDPDAWVESFFDVFYDPFHTEIPVNPGTFMPGENFQFEIAADFFGPGSDPFDGVVYDECVMVTPMGTLEPWYPNAICADNVPPSMSNGESVCFEVCHKVYDILLGPGTEAAIPEISIVPGCDLPCGNPGCTPGGELDYCANTWFDGLNWHLRFEYSNPMVEPVCYCVTYEGNRPECLPHVLAALDERDQMLQVTLWVTGEEAPPCNTTGMVEVCRSDMPGITYNPFLGGFETNEAYLTGEVPGSNDSALPPGSQVTFTVHVDYDDPYDDVWLTEEVMVGPTGEFEIDDTGGECVGDNVPPSMEPNTPYCFEVCHRVYHIDLGIFTQEPLPDVVVIPGCDVPCIDPGCIPGGDFDYCYNLVWLEDHYELEFEYSNEMIEPVCYCVTVEATEIPCETHALVVLDETNQLLKVSLLAFDPGVIEPCEVSGTVNVSSVPAGLMFSNTSWTFTGVGDEWTTHGVSVTPEPDNVDSFFDIYVEIDFDDPSQPDIIETESVELDLVSGALLINDVGGECPDGVVHVPAELLADQPECFIVCHDVYYIPLTFDGPGIPVVTVTPGCDMSTPCNEVTACTPGGLYDYRYDVFKVGGSWYLEFEYSNDQIEPVCYCVVLSEIIPRPYEAYLLAALNEEQQTFDISVWTSDCTCEFPASGTITISRDWLENDPDAWVESFFDVFCEIPHLPGGSGFFDSAPIPPPDPMNPAGRGRYKIAVDFFGPGSDPFDGVVYYENVVMNLDGTFSYSDPYDPCVGVSVPPVMTPGQSECFIVCHDIYDIELDAPSSDGEPIISVIPGCTDEPCSLPIICTPGGVNDYCYRFYDDGVHWHLLFEYSNPYREPVCYCVTYEGVKECATHELVALDERDQTLDMTMWMTGTADPPCLIPVDVTVCRTDQPAAAIVVGSYILDSYDNYLTVSVPADNGGNPPGTAFQYVAYFDYGEPYDDVLITEEVMVDATGLLQIDDTGGECVGDNVPSLMDPYTPYCFHVCHKIYHIDLGIVSHRLPIINIIPGCDLPCDDPTCTPGGIYDYRYDLVWAGSHWELEFEYSNENIEPVCYCVMVEPDMTPPIPVTDFRIHYDYSEATVLGLDFFWEAPEAGFYTIYATDMPNSVADPAGSDWDVIHRDYYLAGDCQWTLPGAITDEYMIFVILYTP